MAAGLMRKIAGDIVQVHSAGTKPGDTLNHLSAQVLAEDGVDISGEKPKLIDPQLVRDVDVVVTLGREAHVEPVPGTRFESWDTDEPSERGIDGIERMRLVRDDIAARVADLYTRLQGQSVLKDVPIAVILRGSGTRQRRSRWPPTCIRSPKR